MTQTASSAGPSVSLITLGCKLNQADSELLAREFTAAGCCVVDRPVSADIFVINTCSVTHTADRKSRRLVRLARRLSPTSTVVLTGCYAETGGPDLATATGADLVLGNASKTQLVQQVIGSHTKQVHFAEELPVIERTASALRTRAFLKIQEGCNDVCAFCIVPRTRGREQSTPIDDIVERVHQCEQEGVQEVVLTGTQLGAYGRDGNGGLSPRDVIRAVLAETSVPRIRFSSLQPQDITPELVSLWEDPRLCRHFHLALQSGSETVLRRMRRRYSATEYRSALVLIREAIPDVAVTTDVIVGFPGESDAEFDESHAFCEEAGFTALHVFPYSRRSGTTADKMHDHVTPDTKRTRMERMLALKGRLEDDFRRRYLGRRLAVLWETERSTGAASVWEGLTDNYLRVFTEAALPLHNRLTGVRITGLKEDGLTGVLEGY
jgi:threonylcarbamoyladenosine tRNA methylthiotransferase MtaB